MPDNSASVSWREVGEWLDAARAEWPGQWSVALAYTHKLGDAGSPGVWSVCVSYQPIGKPPPEVVGRWESFGYRGTYGSAPAAFLVAGSHVIGHLERRRAAAEQQAMF